MPLFTPNQVASQSVAFTTATLPIMINAKDAPYNAKGIGTGDDTAALQSALTAAAGKALIIPAGIYPVTASLLYSGNTKILGAGDSNNGTIIRVKTGTALTTPILCSAEWYNNSATCGNPVEISDIQIDGNNATSGANAHGLAAMNYWSSFDNLSISSVAGEGFRFTAFSRNGTHITNTCVEPKIRRIQVRNTGGHGIHVYDDGTTLNSCTDGFLEDCIVQSAGGLGIYIEMGPGWLVSGNHVYGTVQDAIYVKRCFATRVHFNYVDGYGSGSSSFIAGVGMAVADGRGSSCIGNHVGFEFGSTASGVYQGIDIAGAGSNAATCVVMGNTVIGGSQSGSIGYQIETNGSQVGHPWVVYFHDNDSAGVVTRLSQDSNVTGGNLVTLGHVGSEGRAPTAAAGANAGTSPPAPVLTGCTDLSGKITFGTGTTPAAGAQVVVTFQTAYGSAPKVVISPINSASASLNFHVTSTTTTFTVSCVTAPSASQGNTIYGFNYHVFL